jgi:nucleoid DNA-binding protein
MNKKDLVREISKNTMYSQAEVKIFLKEFKEALLREFLKGNSVLISGLGKFEVVEQKPRPVRNLKTKEEMVLKPYPQVKFRVSTNIKKLLKKKIS